MSKKMERLLESISTVIGTDASNAYAEGTVSQGTRASAAQEAKHIKVILDDLIAKHGQDTARSIMRPCGHQCISAAIIEEAKAAYQRMEGLQAFLDDLNSNHIGGGQLRLAGDVIVGIYDRCYCNTARNTENMSPVYCECSAGWYEKLFSSVFEKPVGVVVKKSIVRGDATCEFEISRT